MPYIPPTRRNLYAPELERVQSPTSSGDLNYVLTRVIDKYLTQNELSYEAINKAIGVLECAKLELYRRIAAPYEDGKVKQNGDVYTVVVP